MHRNCFAILVLLILLASLTLKIDHVVIASGLPSGKVVVGYTNTGELGDVSLNHVTHVVLERVQIRSSTDMTLEIYGSSFSDLASAVSTIHAAGAKAYIELYEEYDADLSYNAIFNNKTYCVFYFCCLDVIQICKPSVLNSNKS